MTPELLDTHFDFRERELHTYDVNEIFSFNEHILRKIFKIYTHPNKQFITNKECIELIYKKAYIKLPEIAIT